jgi:hypothetical protein
MDSNKIINYSFRGYYDSTVNNKKIPTFSEPVKELVDFVEEWV